MIEQGGNRQRRPSENKVAVHEEVEEDPASPGAARGGVSYLTALLHRRAE